MKKNQSIIFRTSYLLFFLQIALSANIAYAATFEPNSIWNKKRLVLCFNDNLRDLAKTRIGTKTLARIKHSFVPGRISAQERAIFEKTTNDNYNLQETGIYFTGFKSCSQTQETPDLIVFKGLKPFHILSMPYFGRSTVGHDTKVKTNPLEPSQISIIEHPNHPRKANYLILTSFLPYQIAHELGHTVGLRHEHIKKWSDHSNPNDKCYKFLTTSGLSREYMGQTAQSYNYVYDNKSIMDYCHLHFTSRHQPATITDNLLSPVDRETLRFLYP